MSAAGCVSTFKIAEWCASRLPRSRGCRRIYGFPLSAKSSLLSRAVTCSPRSPNFDPQTDFYRRDKLGAANSLAELIHLYLEVERSQEDSSWTSCMNCDVSHQDNFLTRWNVLSFCFQSALFSVLVGHFCQLSAWNWSIGSFWFHTTNEIILLPQPLCLWLGLYRSLSLTVFNITQPSDSHVHIWDKGEEEGQDKTEFIYNGFTYLRLG